MVGIVRIEQGRRIFPIPNANFYKSEPDVVSGLAASTGRKILNLSNARFSRWQRITGRGLDRSGRVGRMLLLHRLAFDAERNAQWHRADFFWVEAHTVLRRTLKKARIWNALVDAVGRDEGVTAEDLKIGLVQEVFLDVHAAFANARLRNLGQISLDDRAFVHLRFIRKLLPLSPMSKNEQAAMLADAVSTQIAVCEKANKSDAAVELARSLYDLAPDNTDYQRKLATAHFQAAICTLSDQPKGRELSEAKGLQEASDRLDELRRAHPYNLMLYELIGHCQFLRSIRLANGDRGSEGLVAARKTQVFFPSHEQATAVMQQLIDNMSALQKRMAEVEAQLRQSGNATLTADGLAMQAEARRGFSLLEAYMKSGEPEAIASAREKASARSIWLELCLPQPEGNWDERAAALIAAVVAIFGNADLSMDALAAAFEREASQRPLLAGIDAPTIAAFIRRRKGLDDQAQEKPVERPPAEESVALIETAMTPARRDREPFGYWLFGHQDIGARLAAMAGATAIVMAVGAVLIDGHSSSVRASAYAAIVAAAPQDDDRTVVEQAGRFLATLTMRHNDPREGQVRSLLAQAREAPNRRIRDAAVNEMQQALAQGDAVSVMNAVEKFAAAPPLQDKDPRSAAMLEAYASKFVHWFASLEGTPSIDVADRMKSYRTVSATLAQLAGEKR